MTGPDRPRHEPEDVPRHAAPDPTASDPLAVFRHAELPRWSLVRRRFDDAEIADVEVAVAEAIEPVRDSIRPGLRVCLAVGSRGIDRIAEVTRATASVVRAAGASVFVVPAMGSHGGATPDGQLDVLASLGITEASIGCEIRSSLETVEIGRVLGTVPVFVDRVAHDEADVIVPINRVKPHTDFTGPVESGLLKMISIGLGKQRGADTFHGLGFARFGELIPEVARHTLATGRIPFGIALLENEGARLRRIEAVPAAAMLEREPVLLEEADRHLARLPIAAIDVLIIDRIGKDISGLGMDSNVVGRYYTGPTGRPPAVQRIVVRGLSPETEGNAVGIGMADVVLREAVDAMDPVKTYMNCITAKTPEGARIAMQVDTDREAIDVAIACCLDLAGGPVRVVRILDTKRLGWFYASEPLLAEIAGDARCEIQGPPAQIGLDAADRLSDPLPA